MTRRRLPRPSGAASTGLGGLGSRAPGHRATSASWIVVAGALVLGVVGCGSTPSSAAKAEEQSFLAQIHDGLPSINQLRTDSQLVELGQAVCSGFTAGVSYQVLADRMALQDGNLPTSALGTVITAAGEHLCPRYTSLVT